MNDSKTDTEITSHEVYKKQKDFKIKIWESIKLYHGSVESYLKYVLET